MKTSRISKITIGRLYNLGSYEHVRYELTTEVPEGESAETAVKGMEHILEGLSPLTATGSSILLTVTGSSTETGSLDRIPRSMSAMFTSRISPRCRKDRN